MAKLTRRLAHNAGGPFYVDASCIDCDTCRWMAPDTFVRREEQASVDRQPRTEVEQRRAEMALLSCPTASIGNVDKPDLGPAQRSLPEAIDGGVYHCGYHHEASFGAASYLVVRPEGNVLVDSPRFTRPLVRRLEDLGGVRWLFLTHRDDVADHAQFRRHFGCDRILHARDRTSDTADVELAVEGERPIAVAGDDALLLIPVPGHTEGSTCLLYRDRYLFSGDHLAWSAHLGHPYAFRDACWFDWTTQIDSMRRLARHRFDWILPGHGRRCRFPADEMTRQMATAVTWMARGS